MTSANIKVVAVFVIFSADSSSTAYLNINGTEIFKSLAPTNNDIAKTTLLFIAVFPLGQIYDNIFFIISFFHKNDILL